jgi:predicted NAD/FAD-binding protein
MLLSGIRTPRTAVVGGGISGLTAAYLLSNVHEVTLFEASTRLGGHTYTVPVGTESGALHVDMGFIVFNEANYPLFTRLLRKLEVDSQPSEMSFSVRSEATGLEYRSTSLDTLFAQRRNLFSPSFYRLLRDIVRFNRESRELLVNGNGPGPTLEDYVARGGYSRRFWNEYLVPMGSAIWSAAPQNMRRFPASYLVRFFANHGFLDSNGGIPWRTIRGGSHSYLGPLALPFANRVRLRTPVRAIRRHRDFVSVSTDAGTDSFDHVVIAVHTDQAIAMLVDPTEAEKEILGNIPYQTNRFNPVSFYYAFEPDGKTLCAIVAEINNTPWGEQHCYVLAGGDGDVRRFDLRKDFHISPFFPMDLGYRWQFSKPAERLSVHMETYEGERLLFDATLSMERDSLTPFALNRRLVAFPWMTLQVISRIYWQAFRLWWKKAPYYPNPESPDSRRPAEEVSTR